MYISMPLYINTEPSLPEAYVKPKYSHIYVDERETLHERKNQEIQIIYVTS
jgi:hypothetical protein